MAQWNPGLGANYRTDTEKYLYMYGVQTQIIIFYAQISVRMHWQA
jgi:hypothetical protein